MSGPCLGRLKWGLEMSISASEARKTPFPLIERVHDDREVVQLLLSDAAMDLVWFRGQVVVTGPMRRPG